MMPYFLDVHQSLLQQNTCKHNTASSMLHNWIVFSGFCPFPSHVTMVIMAKPIYASFIRQQDMSSEMKDFVSVCICKL